MIVLIILIQVQYQDHQQEQRQVLISASHQILDMEHIKLRYSKLVMILDRLKILYDYFIEIFGYGSFKEFPAAQWFGEDS